MSDLITRLDRLPLSRWHKSIRLVMGVTTLFDGFDAVMVALVLPLLSKAWHLNAGHIGALLAIGYGGQALGAIVIGRLSEGVGRIHALQLAVLIFGSMSLASAFAQTYEQMLILRFIAGIGLGGEMPVAATYMMEMAPSSGRGRYFLLYELMFPIGFVVASLVGAVELPTLGWRVFFAMGSLPLLLLPAIQWLCPESPRWLLAKGRISAAQAGVAQIERRVGVGNPPAPAKSQDQIHIKPQTTRLGELFEGIYLQRTIVVWILWAATYSVVYGAVGWIPTLLQSVYKLSLQSALNLMLLCSVIGTVANFLCALIIDKVGRGRFFLLSFLAAGAAFFSLGFIAGSNLLPFIVVGFSALAVIGTVSFSLYLYTPEIYPTRMRATGVSLATFWMRISSVVAPLIVGLILPAFGISAVFFYFGAASLIGATALLLGSAVEGADRSLEDISP